MKFTINSINPFRSNLTVFTAIGVLFTIGFLLGGFQ